MRHLFTKFTSLVLASLVIASMLVVFVAPAVSATPADEVCNGVTLTGGTCGGAPGTDINKVVTTVINILSIIAGVAAVIMIIIAGMRYITSNGEAAGVSGAKSALIYALVGIVVVALAQFIVHFVLDRVINAK